MRTVRRPLGTYRRDLGVTQNMLWREAGAEMKESQMVAMFSGLSRWLNSTTR